IWGSGDEWTVTEELRIGTVAGEPEYQFGQLAFLDVGDDGTMYAMDILAQEVRAFDAQGNYSMTIGGPGSGPGELGRGTVFVFVSPLGNVVIPDLGNQRVNRYGPEGEPMGSFPLQIQAGIPSRFEMDSSGRLMAQLRGLAVPGMAALEEGDPIVVYDTTGAVVDTLVMLPKGQTLAGTTEGQLSMVLFSPEPLWALDETGSVYFAMNDQYRILVNDPDGALTRVITRDVERKPVEESDRNSILSALRDQYVQFGVPPAQIEQLMQGIGFADSYPAFGQIFLGPDETLWVQRIRSARDMAEGAEEGFEFDAQDIGSPQWEIFDAEGRYLGVVTLPEGFTPVNAKGDLLYGVWRDELDVQYVMRLRVNRPPA
ncbi:MAG: hypothetical protein MUO50_04795, partial [Longimicrobiales bacterium]|nr:hypothetical protein [Longimicrobiales bacterium]